jgi:hypothetical protein
MHAVPGPIRGVFMPSSPQKDFDGSHHLYGKKSSDLPDLDCKSTDYASCNTPKIPEWQRNGIPEGVTDHSTQARKY